MDQETKKSVKRHLPVSKTPLLTWITVTVVAFLLFTWFMVIPRWEFLDTSQRAEVHPSMLGLFAGILFIEWIAWWAWKFEKLELTKHPTNIEVCLTSQGLEAYVFAKEQFTYKEPFATSYTDLWDGRYSGVRHKLAIPICGKSRSPILYWVGPDNLLRRRRVFFEGDLLKPETWKLAFSSDEKPISLRAFLGLVATLGSDMEMACSIESARCLVAMHQQKALDRLDEMVGYTNNDVHAIQKRLLIGDYATIALTSHLAVLDRLHTDVAETRQFGRSTQGAAIKDKIAKLIRLTLVGYHAEHPLAVMYAKYFTQADGEAS